MEQIGYFLQDNLAGVIGVVIMLLVALGFYTKLEKFLKVAVQIGELIIVACQAVLDDKKVSQEELDAIKKEWQDVKDATKA